MSNFFRTRRAAGIRLALLGLSWLGWAAGAQAQTAQEPFGRVRLQYKKLEWEEFTTQNFNVFYYAGGEASARRTADYAEQELLRITALVGYFPYAKTTLLLYNSVGDLRQSNINLPSPNTLSGGEAQLARQTKVEVAFTGRETDFKRELSYQITQVLLNDMMYGGSLREVLQSNYLLQLPGWFVDGASAYAAEGWSVDMDAYMRDMVRQYPTGNRTAPFFERNPRLAGQSIWNYIAERYGYGAVQNVLNLTRITRDVELGVSSSLNVPYRVFQREWVAYYRQLNTLPALEARVALSDSARLSGRNRRGLEVFSQPVFSPDGQHLAYAANDQGRYRVVVADRDGRHRRTLLRGGYRSPEQQTETRLPVLAWRGNAQVAVAEFLQGQMVLRVREAGSFDLAGRLRRTLQLHQPATIFAPYDQVLDMSYSPDGKALVFTGVRNGQNDLYLLRAGSRQPERLTNDLFDDQQAVFLPGGKALVFSSNRYLDSLGRPRPASFGNVVNNYDLFIYHLDGRAQPVQPLASTISNETRPRPVSDDEILYLSEESGVRGIYRYILSSGKHEPVSRFNTNVQDFDFSPATHGLAFVPQVQARDLLYLYPRFGLLTGMFLGKTARQQTLEARSQPAPAKSAPAATGLGAPTTGAGAPAPGAAGAANPPGPTRRRASGQVNTGNYQFDEDEDEAPARPRHSAARPTAAPQAAANRAAGAGVAGPYRYDTRFMADNLVTGAAIDPLLGFGLLLQANLSDGFENQRIQANGFGQLDFHTSNISLSYTNLTRRFDWGVSYQKQAVFRNGSDLNIGAFNNGELFRFGRQSVSPTVAYPFTHSLSLRGGPRYDNVSRTLTGQASQEYDLNRNYLGYNAELVFDNSRQTGENMLLGTRLKAGILQLNQVGSSGGNFGKFYIDLRHYQKIHRQLVWANRVSYGQFFGNAEAGDNPQQVFRLGGMDNWISQKYEKTNFLPASPSSPVPDPTGLFYQQFVTNLRGFDLSKRTGTRYVLLNSELRLPIVQYLSHGPVYSGFFRNLQFIGFLDAGTAYSGGNPFSTDNSINTVKFGGNGNVFSGTAVNFTNPILVGYGAGVRSTLLGFYVKYDIAWGEENYLTTGPKHYLTLGHDF